MPAPLILLLAALAPLASPARAQASRGDDELPGQTVEVSRTVDNRHYILCPSAYRNIPCPTCPTGKENLCGDVPGILPGFYVSQKIDHATCDDDGQSAATRFQDRLLLVKRWEEKIKEAVAGERSVVSALQTQSSLYGGQYASNGTMVDSAAGFTAYAIQKTLLPLEDKASRARACLAAVSQSADGCFHAYCPALEGLEEDLGRSFPQALARVTDGVAAARMPADDGLPDKLLDERGKDRCAVPEVPCVQQMNKALSEIEKLTRDVRAAALEP